MPFPKDHIQEKIDDCFRCCLAYCLDKHPSRVKFFTPSDDMYELYNEWLQKRFGLSLLDFGVDTDEDKETCESLINLFMQIKKNWIAIVPSRQRGEYHAVVMNGSKLVYDPEGPEEGRTRTPRKFHGVIVVADNIHTGKDGSFNFIY